MTCKLLLALAMSAVVLGGCEYSKPEVAESKPEVEYLTLLLLCASKDATPSQVQAFLGVGADVNARDEGGGSALMWAAMENRKLSSRVLFES